MIRRLLGFVFSLVFLILVFVVLFAIGGMALIGTIFAAIWGFLVMIWGVIIGFIGGLF